MHSTPLSASALVRRASSYSITVVYGSKFFITHAVEKKEARTAFTRYNTFSNIERFVSSPDSICASGAVKQSNMLTDSKFLMSDEQPRKKMRKGTHSCTECRRRKKSCIPTPEAPSICTECAARGVECREQQPDSATKRPAPESKQNLQQRVAELEAALQAVVTKLGGTPPRQESPESTTKPLVHSRPIVLPPTPAASSSVSSPETRLENAPVFSLFDNSILSRLQDDKSRDASRNTSPSASESDSDPSAKIDNIRCTLLSLFPAQQELDLLLSGPQAWWDCFQTIYPAIYGTGPGVDIKQFVTQSRASGSVQKICKALLCVSICLQEASSSSLAKLSPSLTDPDAKTHTMDLVHDLVISDDDIAGTIDGVECLFMHAKHDSNEGRLRRAWITTRRALSFAQLLGLQIRPGSTRSTDTTKLRGESLWEGLYQCDRYLSLLLGLPYAVSDVHRAMPGHNTPGRTTEKKAHSGEEYVSGLANAIGHIIDRNQEPPSNNTLPLTVKIEGELSDLAASMPSEWWSAPITPEDVQLQKYNRLLPQMWHHHARMLLHLPFMLKATTDRRFEYNRIAALESSREMLTRYQMFRPAIGFGSSVCKVIDFQTFTAAMVLVLNLLSTSHNSPAHDQREAAIDEQLIADLYELLQRASMESGGGVTTQAARALKMFCKEKADPCPYGQNTTSIVVPYFGTVVFGRGKSFANQAYLKTCEAPQAPVQLPTPETDTLDSSIHNPANFETSLASMPSDFNFGGYQLQQQQGMGIDGDVFANVNLDLDQDWSWFWDNTNMT